MKMDLRQVKTIGSGLTRPEGVMAHDDGSVYTARGTVEGTIGDAPRGAHGFGYDPIFVLTDGRHMAELSPAEKHAISHRGTALAKFKPTLLKVVAELDPD